MQIGCSSPRSSTTIVVVVVAVAVVIVVVVGALGAFLNVVFFLYVDALVVSCVASVNFSTVLE